jgi:hypothetical protein
MTPRGLFIFLLWLLAEVETPSVICPLMSMFGHIEPVVYVESKEAIMAQPPSAKASTSRERTGALNRASEMDRYVGARIRERRILMGLSHQAAAERTLKDIRRQVTGIIFGGRPQV